MKETTNLITVLNQMLVDELSSVNRNIFHSKGNKNSDDERLFEEIEKVSAEEFKQAEWLVKRIMFLEVLRTRHHPQNQSQNNSIKNYGKSRNVG
jgi:bacterioferritin (cytochrome b1)